MLTVQASGPDMDILSAVVGTTSAALGRKSRRSRCRAASLSSSMISCVMGYPGSGAGGSTSGSLSQGTSRQMLLFRGLPFPGDGGGLGDSRCFCSGLSTSFSVCSALSNFTGVQLLECRTSRSLPFLRGHSGISQQEDAVLNCGDTLTHLLFTCGSPRLEL